MAFDKSKFIERFIEDAKEQVDRLNAGLLSLEKDPHDAETLNAVFRSAHTIKGSSKMMKIDNIAVVAHRMEDVLDAIRENKLDLSQSLSDVLFSTLDTISDMLGRVSRQEEIEPQVVEEATQILEKVLSGEPIAPPQIDPPADPPTKKMPLASPPPPPKGDMPQNQIKVPSKDPPHPPRHPFSFDKSKFLNRFTQDAASHLQVLKTGLQHMQKGPLDEETLNGVLRAAHTIKGASKMMKFDAINQVAHKLEEALEALKNGKLPQTSKCVNVFMDACRTLSEMLVGVANEESIDPQVADDACLLISNLFEGDEARRPVPPSDASPIEVLDNQIPKLEEIRSLTSSSDNKKFLERYVEDTREHIQKINKGIILIEKNPSNLSPYADILRSVHIIKGASKMVGIDTIHEVSENLENALKNLSDQNKPMNEGMTDIILSTMDAIAIMLDKVIAKAPIDDAIVKKKCTDLGVLLSSQVAQGTATAPLSPKKVASVEPSAKQSSPPLKDSRQKSDPPKAPPAFNKSKFLAKFIEDTEEHIGVLNESLLILEKDPGDLDVLDKIFRSAHTIKGASRMMKIDGIPEIAHKLEDIFEALKSGAFVLTGDMLDIILKGVDRIVAILDHLADGTPTIDPIDDICALLDKVAQNEGLPQSPISETIDQPKPSPLQSATAHKAPSSPSSPKVQKIKSSGTVRISEEKLDELIKLMSEIVSSQSRLKQKLYDIRKIEKLEKTNFDCLPVMGTGNPEVMERMTESLTSSYVLLKQLAADMVEYVNMQDLLTEELQDRSLKMRMLPLSTIFDSFHRTVRDLSRSFGKEIDFQVEGGDTELDKKLIEKLGDPLIHMIRNGIDHGIETPEERIRKGKPPNGYIKLAASYESGNVLIELMDDGAGISVEKVKNKALKRKMIAPGDMENLSENDIIQLIFHPGFSTSEMITDISGRGVGMDVVNKNICEDLKGSIQIETKEDQGTHFYIRLPLTMAIMNVLVITVSEMVFAIPSNFINEIIRVSKSDIIDVVDKKAIRLREQIIPVVFLHEILGLKKNSQADENSFLVLMAAMGNEQIGLIVNSLLQAEDRAIKPLPAHMKNITLVSGVTITGNNELNSVLHIPKIFEATKEMKIKRDVRKEDITDNKGIHILAVDDSFSTREIEKSILESYGYRVSLAGDGIEALESIKNEKFDIVISDIDMPRLDGFSLTRKLRENHLYKDTPIILLSSRDKQEDKRKGLQVGADAYIIKGAFDQTNLVETIQNLVG